MPDKGSSPTHPINSAPSAVATIPPVPNLVEKIESGQFIEKWEILLGL